MHACEFLLTFGIENIILSFIKPSPQGSTDLALCKYFSTILKKINVATISKN